MTESKGSASSPHVVARRIVENVGLALAGKRSVVELAVTALLAHGHLLVEDVPGVGKTTLARALAQSLGVDFRRIQFTSDLMPSDVLGGNVYVAHRAEFEWRPGPLFTTILLADEVNRATPRTQSALLEAMEERQVSIDGTTHALDENFFVVATQNPEDFHGTYPLPESQLDRFLLRLAIGYPSPQVEREILGVRRGKDPVRSLEPVVSQHELSAASGSLDTIVVSSLVVDYLHAIVLETRTSELFELGASTRAALALERAVRAFALVHGRERALPDDVKALAVPALAHRVRLRGSRDGLYDRSAAERAIRLVLDRVPVPV